MAKIAVKKRKRVTVLFSGRGSNMETLIKASLADNYPAVITDAITNRPNAGGIKIAASYDIETSIFDHKAFDSREAHEEVLRAELEKQNPDIIVLAGYMRIFTKSFVEHFPGKMLNIHPSLLPKFKGINTHKRAIEAGEKIHGCSVHFVEASLDGGPVIAQSSVPVKENDTPDTLSDRVLVQEHLLYPKALALVASETVTHHNGKVILSPNFDKTNTDFIIAP